MSKSILVRGPYDFVEPVVHVDGDIPDECKTLQDAPDHTDLNLIMARAMRGQMPAWSNPMTPQYGDFSDVPSLAEAYEIIRQAEESFMTLPASARAELGNDFRNLQSADRSFFQRHGLVRPNEPDALAPATGSEGGTPSKPLKKAAKSDQSDQV